MNAVAKIEDFDMSSLNRELDRTKSKLYQRKYAAFFGSLLCSLNFSWDESVKTAATDGVNLYWAPSYFLKLPEASRVTDLMHEIWHVARFHMVRRGERCPDYWNIACDIRIDMDLRKDGFTFEGIEGVLTNPRFNDPRYETMVEEDIYDDLIRSGCPIPLNFKMDMMDGPVSPAQIINTVIRASQQAKLAGAGNMPGDLEETINKFLTPIVPWEPLLHRFMQELVEESTSWAKPNRRFYDIYMPSRSSDEGALEHLIYFEDTSGSISTQDAVRFNSEFKYVKDTYRPKKMTLVQFDTVIQHVQEYDEDDPFDQVVIYGKGGTCLKCVREYILEHRPTAAVVFSDLQVAPMEPLGFEIPIIWVCISNRSAKVPFGEVIHIR